MDDAVRKIRIPDHIGYERVEGDFVLVNLKSGKYLGLDAVGSAVWQTLASGGGVDEAVREIVARYEVAEERARQDVENLLRTLADKGVIEVQGG